MNILEIKDLVKDFNSTRALDHISFSVSRGTICGLLGPNGAGKTTILRIINSILTADAGEVIIDGVPASFDTSRLLGYMPEERGLYDKMTIEDQIMYFGQLKGGDKKRLREVMNEYISLFNLEGMQRRKVKELSKGNQQKVQIISTIVHEPEIVVLDEPFSGFDPINGAILQELIERLHKQGTTIILSSHNMPAIESMCSDIVLVNKGKILLDGKLNDIKESHKPETILFTTRQPINIPLLNDSGLITSIESTPVANWRKGFAYRVKKQSGIDNFTLLKNIAVQGELIHFEEELPSLNDIFIKYTNGK